jgi:predicted RNA binding protein YcfA (HicA-like mRNA interferase family)
MRQYTSREFIRIVKFNGFRYSRHSGDHAIYVNDKGKHISIPRKILKCVIARRLIKENNLVTDFKKKKKK